MKYTQYKLARSAIAPMSGYLQIEAICDAVNQNLLANGLGIHYESDACYLQTKAEGEAYEAYQGLSEHYQGLTRVVSETGEF